MSQKEYTDLNSLEACYKAGNGWALNALALGWSSVNHPSAVRLQQRVKELAPRQPRWQAEGYSSLHEYVKANEGLEFPSLSPESWAKMGRNGIPVTSAISNPDVRSWVEEIL